MLTTMMLFILARICGMHDMTKGGIFKNIVVFAVPLFLGSVLQQIYSTINGIIVGQYLGVDALAAIGVSGPVIYFITSTILGVTIGFSIVISQYRGAENTEKIAQSISTLMLFLLLAGLLTSFFCGMFSNEILKLLGIPPNLMEGASKYLSYLSYGIGVTFLMMGIGGVLRALGDGMTSLYAMIFACLLNIALDFYFVLELGWGVEGTAIATLISQICSFSLLVVYLAVKNTYFRLAIARRSFNATELRRGVSLGLPLAAQHIFLSGGILVLIWVVVPYGESVIAALTIVGRIEMFMTMAFLELSSSLTTFVGVVA
jgi:putative MATE family efflux protein